jgi:hypothetical protein
MPPSGTLLAWRCGSGNTGLDLQTSFAGVSDMLSQVLVPFGAYG